MNKKEFENLLACPKCKKPITKLRDKNRCPKCKLPYRKRGPIWDFLFFTDPDTRRSSIEYDALHKKSFGGPIDGSYEILASMARGNRTVDIACGEGIIETLSPDTVGVEFSYNALKKAMIKGAKYLVLADAHELPFKNDAFDLAISNGNLEHFYNPQKAIKEMARISKIQIQIVHKYPPFPFSELFYKLFTFFLKITHQPIEKPINDKNLERMIKKAGLSIIYKGVWTLPFNYGRVIKFLPEFKNSPVCSFVITIKK